MDGRDGGRLLLPVPDADAVPRPAPAGRGRSGDVPRLQSLALRAPPRGRAAHHLDALSSVHDPDAAYKTVKDFGDKKGVVGFMVTSPRYKPVHDNAYVRTYALLEEMGKPI